jgi:hypothetical protein
MVLPAISFSNWIGLLRQGHTANEIIGNLNAAAIEALADQTGRSKLLILERIFSRDKRKIRSVR